MQYEFPKYSGCGNDFILVDNRLKKFSSITPEIISHLCNRQRGIGADGLIFLENSKKANFKMRIFNSDGSEAEMCGNGIRCLARFIKDLGVEGSQFTIETMLNVLSVSVEQSYVSVEMGSPTDIRWNIAIDSFTAHHLDTGVPHAVIFCENSSLIDIQNLGPYIRHHSIFFPRGANANFAHIDFNNTIHLRTFERGVENETLACGTGATATALAAAKIYNIPSPILVKVLSGETLKISFTSDQKTFSQVTLSGPATRFITTP